MRGPCRWSLFLLSVASTVVSAQPTIDPQALVGEWNGTWVDNRAAQRERQYSLTIERVDGNRVFGHGTLMIRRSFDFKFVGPCCRSLDILPERRAGKRGTLAAAEDPMSTPLSRIIAVSDVAWQERGAGVRMKSLWEHPESTRRAVMTRIEPGAKLPLHRHDGDELVFVVEGAVVDEFGTVTSGNVGYRPNGCVHTVASPNGATLLAILTGGVTPVTERTSGPSTQVIAVSELPWIDARPGVRQKRIWEDKVTERRALLARFEPGATLPKHRHVGDELIFVIEGANADESGVVATGNMNYRPEGCVHTVTTQNGATVLAVVWGHTEPV